MPFAHCDKADYIHMTEGGCELAEVDIDQKGSCNQCVSVDEVKK